MKWISVTGFREPFLAQQEIGDQPGPPKVLNPPYLELWWPERIEVFYCLMVGLVSLEVGKAKPEWQDAAFCIDYEINRWREAKKEVGKTGKYHWCHKKDRLRTPPQEGFDYWFMSEHEACSIIKLCVDSLVIKHGSATFFLIWLSLCILQSLLFSVNTHGN